MKKIVLLIIFASQFGTITAQENTALNWIPNYDIAKQKAKEAQKPMLIFFTGSDWCDQCKMLDADFFSSEKFIKIAKEHFILYKANFPRRTDLLNKEQKETNLKLDAMYSKSLSKRSFPTIVITDASGKELGFLESYNYIHDTSRHFGFLETILAKLKQ